MTSISNKSLAIRGVAWASTSHAISIAVTFLVTPVLLRTLGAEQYGIWSIVIALTGYYGLVNMGIGKANTKYIAQHDALDDSAAVCCVMSTGLAILSVLAVVVISVSFLVAFFFPYVFDLRGFPVRIARWVVILTGTKVATELVGQVFAAGLIARKRFDLSNALLCGRLIATGVLTILVVKAGWGLLGMACVYFGITLLSVLTMYVFAIRIENLPSPRLSSVEGHTGKSLFHFGFLNLVIQLVRRTSLVGGSLLLGLISGPTVVAYYSIAESLTRKSVNLGKTLNSVVMPFASQFEAQSDKDALRQMLILPTRVLMALGILVAGVLLIMGKQFLILWIDANVASHVYPITCILSLSLLIKLPANGLQSTLTGMGRMPLLSRLAIGEGLVMLGLGIALTHAFGVVGMASAVVVAQLLFSGVFLPVYACSNLGYPLRSFAHSTIVPAILSNLPSITTAVLFATLSPATSLVAMLLQIGTLCLLTAATAFFICLDSSFRAEIMRMGTRWLRHKRQHPAPATRK